MSEVKIGEVYSNLNDKGERKNFTYMVEDIIDDLVVYKSYFTRATEKYAFDENVREYSCELGIFLENYVLVSPKPEEFMHFRTRPSKEVSQAIYNAVTCDYREAAKAIQKVDLNGK